MPSQVPSVEEFREKARARLDAKKKAAAGNLPAKATNVILSKQYENLRKAVNECAKSEEKRAVKMERATSKSERDKLEARFDNEREIDRKRIVMIKEDVEGLKSSVLQGTVNIHDLKSRQSQQLEEAKLPPRLANDHNRFQGLETPIDFILHKANLGMFDRHDIEFAERQKRLQPKFDIVQETKRCQLLEQKKQILTQVIQVQQREINELERNAREAANQKQTARARVDNIRINTETFKQEWDTKQQKLAAWRAQKANGFTQQPPQSRNGAGGMNTARSDTSSRASTASMATFASPSVFNKPGAYGGGSRAQSGAGNRSGGGGGGARGKIYVPPLQLAAPLRK